LTAESVAGHMFNFQVIFMISFAALFIDMTEHHIFYCLSTVPVNCLDGWSDPLSFCIFFEPAILCPSPNY